MPEDQEEIEVKVMEKSVLIRVQCENNNNDKKILPRLLSSISKLHLVILTINALPFGNRIDITIMAQVYIIVNVIILTDKQLCKYKFVNKK